MQLLAVQHEHRVPALERLRPRHSAALLVGAAVPHDHAALLAGRAFEVVVRELMILDLDGEALDGGIHRGALRDRPRAHRAADLEAQVEVVGARAVLLHDEHAGGDAADRELLMTLGRHLADIQFAHRCAAGTVAR